MWSASDKPSFLLPFLDTPAMKRIGGVGMNCGCEYTSFPRFRDAGRYTRFTHSLGAALIVWRFTGDRAQTLAALFHDIATPVFAHSVDFMRGDYLKQESTESDTERVIREDPEIGPLLRKLGIAVGDVSDYHRYPIADNDSPRLSSDRLEYTLGNLLHYGFRQRPELDGYLSDLTAAPAEDGMPELQFRTAETAAAFARGALECARVYVSDEDRYAMQRLAELLRSATDLGVLDARDLMTTEAAVIAKLEADPRTAGSWRKYRALHRMVPAEEGDPADCRIIPAKKRCIDPLVTGIGRLSSSDPAFRAELEAFLNAPLDRRICAE